ncbi:hypothetical protein [Laceyella tengchongensis]
MIVEMDQKVQDPSDYFDQEPMREIDLYYDKDQKKWIIEGDGPYYSTSSAAKPEGKPIVTQFD